VRNCYISKKTFQFLDYSEKIAAAFLRTPPVFFEFGQNPIFNLAPSKDLIAEELANAGK